MFLIRAMLPLLEAAAAPSDPARVVNVGSIDGLRVPPTPNLCLLGQQGRAAPPDPGAGPEAGAAGDHRECDRAGAVLSVDGSHPTL